MFLFMRYHETPPKKLIKGLSEFSHAADDIKTLEQYEVTRNQFNKNKANKANAPPKKEPWKDFDQRTDDYKDCDYLYKNINKHGG